MASIARQGRDVVAIIHDHGRAADQRTLNGPGTMSDSLLKLCKRALM